MNDQTAPGNSSAAIWITGLCAAVALYVLSPVAVGLLIEKGIVSDDSPMLAVFTPLVALVERWPILEDFYQWLFDQCGVAGF